MDPYPLISVIIPVFNAEPFLDEALASLDSQNYPRLERIMVDDGSRDGAARSAAEKDPSIRYFRQENHGPSAARNLGLSRSEGELITFLDADDIWSGDKLTDQLHFLKKNPAVDVVYGLSLPFRAPRGNSSAKEFAAHPFWSPKPDSALFRRQAFDRVGHFDINLSQGEDLDWFCRAREKGIAMAVIKSVHILYRRHEASLTGGRDHTAMVTPSILRASLLRRREGQPRLQPLPPIAIIEGQNPD